MAQFSSMISGLSEQERSRYLKQRLLQDLQFLEMPDRHERIATAHRRTFKWIFESSEGHKVKWTDFVKWLQNDDELYWITGKAGSGKSTLMKYIYGNRRTRKYLKLRDRTLPVITAGFFFWNSGTNIQMSQQGLLQTLLYESLRQCDGLIPLVFPQRWHSYDMFGQDYHPWSDGELLQGFKRLVKQNDESARFCFFVDGLDEFDGNPTVLINLFKEVVSTSKVKVCLSSRPWLVFEDAFRHHSNLMLQDLTYPDITNFVSSELGSNSHFLTLRARKAKYADKLITDIATKADGVFLWVKLVVTSLLAGLTNSDRISDLQRRLELIPRDLEDLYGKMLDSFDAFYLEHASQLFQLVRASYRPISLLLMSFADEEDASYAIDAKIEMLTDEEKLLRCEETRRRLNSRCKGLLEVPMAEIWEAPNPQKENIPNIPHRPKLERKGKEIAATERMKFTLLDASREEPEDSDSGNEQAEEPEESASVHSGDWETDSESSSEGEDNSAIDIKQRLLCVDVAKLSSLKIEYLHRTVKDYLERDEVWSQLLGATSSSFSPQLSLCRANLLLLKVQNGTTITNDTFWDCIIDSLNYAAEVEAITSEAQLSLIDEVGRVANIFDIRGVYLAERARITPIVVDKVEQVELSILTRLKQENVTLETASWHERYFSPSRSDLPPASKPPAPTGESSSSQNYIPMDLTPPSRLNHGRERPVGTVRILPSEWETPEPLEERQIEPITVPEISELRGRTEQQELHRSASPSPSPSRSRSQSPVFDDSQSQKLDILARWRIPRKVAKNFKTQWPGTHPDVELSCTFHCFVALFPLRLYLKRKLDDGVLALQDQGRRPFLDYLVMRDKKEFVHYQNESPLTPPDLALVKAALEHGADPNQKYGGMTPWQNLLNRAREAAKTSPGSSGNYSLDRPQSRERDMEQWADIVELFIKHGANPLEVQNSPTANAIRDIFGEWDTLRTKKLEKLVKSARHSPYLGRLWSRD